MTRRRLIASLTALALGLGAMSARAQSNEELQKQVQELQAQVRQLQAQRGYNPRDVENTVNTLLRDADRRSPLLADGGVNSGFIDGRFQIASTDGNFTLIPGLHLQFRNVTNLVSPSNERDQWSNGWEMRRLKFSLEGNLFTRDLYYWIIWATDRHTGQLINEEAYIRYAFTRHWTVQLGQFKPTIAQENNVSYRRQAAVERSIVAEALFSGDSFTQGINVSFDNRDNLQAFAAFTDGFNSRNTNFEDHPQGRAFQADWGVNGRVNYKIFGDWKSYSDFTAMKNKVDLLVLGAGFDWTQNGSMDNIRHAVDIHYEMGGNLGAFLEYAGQYVRDPAGTDLYHWGLVSQLSCMFDPKWEAFARYAFLHRDGATPEDSFQEITIGVVRYLKGHSAKLTVDVGWLPNGIYTDFAGAGILASPGENEFYLRAQFQLLL